MVVAKLCRKPPQETKVPLVMGDLFSDRRKVAVACNSCIKKKKKSLCGLISIWNTWSKNSGEAICVSIM